MALLVVLEPIVAVAAEEEEKEEERTGESNRDAVVAVVDLAQEEGSCTGGGTLLEFEVVLFYKCSFIVLIHLY